jgi:RNA polymerase sigma-70 factor (ECF subfamily)
MPSGYGLLNVQEIRARLDAGNHSEAFELLMSHFQNKVFRLAYAMLGNEAVAEETAQDIFIRIWKALGNYRGQSSLSTWIYSIARNTCLTSLGALATRRRTVSIEAPGIQRLAEMGAPAAPARETDLDLMFLLSELPENYRQVLTLFYMEEKSYEEVSRLLGLPMGTVKTHLHRARKQLAVAALEAKMKKGAR